MLPAVLLVIGHLALTTKRFLVTEAGKLKSDEESAETNRMRAWPCRGNSNSTPHSTAFAACQWVMR